MAKIKLSSYLKSVSGTIGNIVFYNCNGREYARVYVKPVNPDTEEQRMVRGTFRDAVRSWQELPQAGKDKYNRQARRLPMSGYNLFISRYMKQNISQPVVKDINPHSIEVSSKHSDSIQRVSTSVPLPFMINDCSQQYKMPHLHRNSAG